MNQVILVGYLADDPKMIGSDDRQACALRVAINEGYFNRERQWVERTTFIDVYQFGKGAEKTFTKAKKGDFAVIGGKLNVREKDRNMYVNARTVTTVASGSKSEPSDHEDGDEIPF